jgi:AcrR family transcriptional regulator
MTIPASAAVAMSRPNRGWAALDREAKRERLLTAAGDLFATHGLDASMPSVAAAAGAGVASVYRLFPSKRDLLAALVVRRLDRISAAAAAACARDGDHWSALVEMLWTIVERDSCDDFLGEARVLVADHADVRRATARTTRSLNRLLTLARAQGSLRADATTLDLKLLFAATRAAKQLEPAAWRRMLELLIDALRQPVEGA